MPVGDRVPNHIYFYITMRFHNKQRHDSHIRLVTETQLLSVQITLTPGLHLGPAIYVGPGFYPKFYGNFCKLLE